MKLTFLVLILASALSTSAAFARIQSKLYQKQTLSDFPEDIKNMHANEVVNVEIVYYWDTSAELENSLVAKPIHLNLHQKLGSVLVYLAIPNRNHGKREFNGQNVWPYYYDLNTAKVDSSILTVLRKGCWAFEFLFADKYSFLPQAKGETTLEYEWIGMKITVPVIVEDENDKEATSLPLTEADSPIKE